VVEELNQFFFPMWPKYIGVERARTSALAEHSLKTKHHIRLEDTRILAKEDHLLKRRIREAIEIIKNPDNLNRDNGLEISDSWIPLIRGRKHH
jgi:hypothetical protein